MSERVTFAECVSVCARQPGLVEQFDRLTGSRLSEAGKGSPIELAVDEAAGRWDADCARFVAFVYECVWIRLPPEVRAVAPSHSKEDTP